ncbi:hypothetical protein PAPYR_10268 [Paratrimastix pyriformis]|uniref:Uncharacterized protein n=1 Tax=Paratrimastix pyriformis TaxID=342808 RepID=A0ABQ8U6G0_9EUKA|nr:hypothetical protein PAPYR_10268 [Paratrimastix pyriformis]
MKQVVLKARAQAGGLPVFYTEFNDGLYFTPSYHDRPFAAAFIMQGDGWGLLNMHGIPKPSYRAYQILHQLGDKELQVTTSGPASPTLQMFAVQAANGSADIDLVLYNHQVIGSPIAPEAVTSIIMTFTFPPSIRPLHPHCRPTRTPLAPTQVTIAGVASRMAGDNVQVRAIDPRPPLPRCLPPMGAPQYLTAAQVSTLARASELQWTSLAAARVGADIQIKATLTPEAVWHVRIPMRR